MEDLNLENFDSFEDIDWLFMDEANDGCVCPSTESQPLEAEKLTGMSLFPQKTKS